MDFGYCDNTVGFCKLVIGYIVYTTDRHTVTQHMKNLTNRLANKQGWNLLHGIMMLRLNTTPELAGKMLCRCIGINVIINIHNVIKEHFVYISTMHTDNTYVPAQYLPSDFKAYPSLQEQ